MSFEEIIKALNPEQAQLVTDHIASIELAKDGQINELTAQVTTLTSEVDTLKKAKPTEQTEDILKDVSPAAKALIEKLQGEVNTYVALQQDAIASERFGKVKALPVDEAELKNVLKTASPAVFSILEKAAVAVENGLVAKGKPNDPSFQGDTADELYKQLEKLAETIIAEESVTKEVAFTKACERNPKIYEKYVKGVK